MMAYIKTGDKLKILGLDELTAFVEAADASQQELFMRFAGRNKR